MATRAGATTTGPGSHCGFCGSNFANFREHLLAAHPACNQCSGTMRFKDRQALHFHIKVCHPTNTGKKGMKPKAHTQPASQPGGSDPASKKGSSKSTSATSMNPRPVGGVAIAQAHQQVQGGKRPGGGFPRQPQGTTSYSAGRGAGGASRGNHQQLAIPQHSQHRQVQNYQPPQSSFVPRSPRLPQRPNAGVLIGVAPGAVARGLRGMGGRELDPDDDDDDDGDDSDEDEDEDEDEDDDDDDSESDTDSSESGENDNDDSSTGSSSDSHDLTTWPLNSAAVDGDQAQNYPNLPLPWNPSGHVQPVPTRVYGNTPASYGARSLPSTIFLPPQVEMLQAQVSLPATTEVRAPLPATTEARAPLPALEGPPPNAPRGPRGQAPVMNAGGGRFVCRDCNSRAFRSCGGLTMHVLHKHKLYIGRKTRNIAKQKGMAKAGEGVWVDGRWIPLDKATRKQLRRGRWKKRWKKKLTPEQKKRNEEKRKRRKQKKKRNAGKRKQKKAEKKQAAEAEKLRAAELATSGALVVSTTSEEGAESQAQEDMLKAIEDLQLD